MKEKLNFMLFIEDNQVNEKLLKKIISKDSVVDRDTLKNYQRYFLFRNKEQINQYLDSINVSVKLIKIVEGLIKKKGKFNKLYFGQDPVSFFERIEDKDGNLYIECNGVYTIEKTEDSISFLYRVADWTVQRFEINVYNDLQFVIECREAEKEIESQDERLDFLAECIRLFSSYNSHSPDVISSFFLKDSPNYLMEYDEYIKRCVENGYLRVIDVDEDDSNNKLTLYIDTIFLLKVLDVICPSTKRHFFLYPTNQVTNDAYTAWKSLFGNVNPVYRHGDVILKKVIEVEKNRYVYSENKDKIQQT